MKWLQCVLFHRKYWRTEPWYHSWQNWCCVCGRTWYEED